MKKKKLDTLRKFGKSFSTFMLSVSPWQNHIQTPNYVHLVNKLLLSERKIQNFWWMEWYYNALFSGYDQTVIRNIGQVLIGIFLGKRIV